MKDDILAQSALNSKGQNGYNSGVENERVIYPAIVVPYGTNDNTEQGRIRARIVSLDDNGNIIGKSSSGNEENYNGYSGRDRDVKDNQLVLCIPLLPQFFYVKPQVGEMVYVILENPKDNTSPRYWIGPIISSKLKLKYQSYEDASRIFEDATYIPNLKLSNFTGLSSIFPEESDVALQGRGDSDLILKNRELLLIAGKLQEDAFALNTESPSYLRLKQITSSSQQNLPINFDDPTHNIDAQINKTIDGKFKGVIIVQDIKSLLELVNDENIYQEKGQTIAWAKQQIANLKLRYKLWTFTTNVSEFKTMASDYTITASINPQLPGSNEAILKKYSQASLTSTNINIYSPRGKFRGESIKAFEISEDLKSFGSFADTLHPSVFGDETIRVLDLIIRLLLEHIHTPQMPLLTNPVSDELKKYTVDGLLQSLISNHIRIN